MPTYRATEDLPVKNFRALDFTAGGNPIKICGLAHPERHNPDPDAVLEGLEILGYSTVVSLDEQYETIGSTFTSANDENRHIPLVIEDFHAPSFEQYERLYSIVKEEAAQGRSIAIHCGEGYGRTGTMLASIALQEAMEMKFKENPAAFMDYDVSPTEVVELGHYSDTGEAPASLGVAQAMDSVRCRITPPKTEGDSVENEAQVASLVELERKLAEKYKQEYTARLEAERAEREAAREVEREVKRRAALEDTDNIKNFRSIGFVVGGNPIEVCGLAHPQRHCPAGKSTNDVLRTLDSMDYHTLISLDEQYSDIRRDFKNAGGDNKHAAVIVEDFTAPTIKQYKKVYSIIKHEAERGRKVAIHCGEGYGRTGTMLAGIALQAELERKFNEDPNSFLDYEVSPTEVVELGHYSETGAAPASPAVARAMDSVRCPITPPKTEGDSVENEDQVASLVDLERKLVAEYKAKAKLTAPPEAPAPVPAAAAAAKTNSALIGALTTLEDRYKSGRADGDKISTKKYDAIEKFIHKYKDSKTITPDEIKDLQELKTVLSKKRGILGMFRAKEKGFKYGKTGLDNLSDILQDKGVEPEVAESVKSITAKLK